jgi:hypothetical protein
MAESAAGSANLSITRARTLTYRDPRETSFPLIVLGVVISAAMLVGVLWTPSTVHAEGFGGEILAFVSDNNGWSAGPIRTLAFAAIWLVFRWRAASHDRRPVPGFGIAAVVAFVMCVPPITVLLLLAGPFAVLGLALLVAAIKARNQYLVVCAAVIGSLGIYESLFGISNLVPFASWAGLGHAAVFLALGGLTLLLGCVAYLIEIHARRSGRAQVN